MKHNIEEAVTVIQNGLLNDPGYRMGWTANIAMAFKDEMERGAFSKENNHSILVTRDMLHKIAILQQKTS
jgi:hypothetical protein